MSDDNGDPNVRMEKEIREHVNSLNAFFADEPRNYLAEAKKIISGTTAMLPEKGHLEALYEAHESEIGRVITALHDLKMQLLTAGAPRG